MRRSRIWPLVVGLFVAGMPASAQQWSAERLLSIGEAQGVAFGQISSIAAAPDGRFFVLDRMESRVYVFSSAGKVERTFGRRGSGPGELSRSAGPMVLTRGDLAVADMAQQRVSLYSATGSLLHTYRVPWRGTAFDWVAVGDRLATLVRPLPGGAQMPEQLGGVARPTVFLIDPRSPAEPETLLTFDVAPEIEVDLGATSMRIRARIEAPQQLLVGDGGQRLLVASTDTYRIRVMDPTGRTTGWLTKPHERHRYTRAEQARMRAEADSAAKEAFASGFAAGAGKNPPKPEIELILPEFSPAFDRLLAGDRFVLARQWAPEGKRAPWDVLDYEGRFLGTLELPRGFVLRELAGDRLYGTVRDEMDVDSVVVLRLIPPARR